MKQRITSLDLRLITAELQKDVVNYRLQNIYNVVDSSRQYVLKFALPDSKKIVVLDCGNRIHLSEFERPTAPAPSNFVTKLRKHLKTRRLSQVKQVGNDRVLILQFSDGLFYLVLEFFSAGNILLLDHQMKILALHRLVNDLGPDSDKYAVNETYKVFDDSLFDEQDGNELQVFSKIDVLGWVSAHKDKLAHAQSDKKQKVYSIHKLLFLNASYLSSDLILKTLVHCNIDSSESCLVLENNEKLLEDTVCALVKSQVEYKNLLEAARDGSVTGIIVEKKNPNFNNNVKDSLEFLFDEFHPFTPYKKSSDYRFQSVPGYNNTLDKFFSTIESTKYALKIENQKQHAEKRLNNARLERDKQIQSLKTQQDTNEQKGNAIMYHASLVESCKEYLQNMISKQMDWTDIENIIKYDATRKKDEASYFKLPLNLLENKIKLNLPDMDHFGEEPENSEVSESNSSDTESESSSSESESDSSSSESDEEVVKEHNFKSVKKKSTAGKQKDQSRPVVTVDIDIRLSAFANARLYFDSKKTAVSKQSKVEKNSVMALRNAEKKIQRDLTKNLKSEADGLRVIRPKYWFEKFYWFVTSENYLCLAGRDDSQEDMIYYRHFSDDGVFVSSDVEGSLKVFVLNPFPGESMSPTTLFQAGIFAMSTSAAWNGKVSTSAWWLKGIDVTKKEFDGSLLGPGRLNYKGEKNYMPPAQMVMGFGLYWLVDEDTAAKHTKERVQRQEEHGLKPVIRNTKKDLEDMNIQEEKARSESNSQSGNEVEEESEQEIEEEVLRPDSGLKYSSEGTDTSSTDNILESNKGAHKSKSVRGKKGKMKKIQEKYADQDEEERKLRMEVLGTLKQVEELEKKKLEERKLEADKERLRQTQAKRGAQREQKAEERELQKYFEKEEDEATGSYMDMLDSLIAKPTKTDVLATAVPVFAPWPALSKFKYKTKIQPGMGKKGKGVTDSLAYFTNRKVDPSGEDIDLDWPKEHDIIRSLKANDLVGVIAVNKMKLVLPGGSTAQTKKGGGKKGKR